MCERSSNNYPARRLARYFCLYEQAQNISVFQLRWKSRSFLCVNAPIKNAKITYVSIRINFVLGLIWNHWNLDTNMSSVESKKGVSAVQRCSVENQKVLLPYKVYSSSRLLVLNETLLNGINVLLALSRWYLCVCKSYTVYMVIFAVVWFSQSSRKFSESDPRENFHFNICLFIVMKTEEKSRN